MLRRHRQGFLAVALAVIATLLVWAAHAAAATDPWSVSIFETGADSPLQLAEEPAGEFQPLPPPGMPVIYVRPHAEYQHVTGFGAALTDSSAWLIYDELSPSVRLTLMQALFSRWGASIDVIRLPMGASDFTANGHPYSYDDMPPGRADPSLKHFSIAHDLAYVIPTLRLMLSINPRVKIIANPWSPPGWMKANDALNDVGHRGVLLRRYYHAWAEYFVKFVRAYQRAGIHITAVTPQNEPGVPARYPGMELPPATERYLVAWYLRPALRAAGLHTRIYGGDSEWGLPSYEDLLVRNRDRHAFDGIAWQCYGGIPEVMSRLHRVDRTLYQFENECANDLTPYSVPEVLIGAMRNWASAAELWNIALDPSGGPVQPPNSGCNGCTGLVTVDETSGQVTLNTTYYQLAQASRFIRPGAVRIGSNNLLRYFTNRPSAANQSGYGAGVGLDDVAFRNPDGSLVLLAYNNTALAYPFAIAWRGRYLSTQLPAYTTATLVWNGGA